MADILLIEDDVDVRNLIALALGQAGHHIRQAENGAEGIKLYLAQSADLVLTDLVMPEKEGISTIMELRKIDPQVTIIAMSGGLAHDPKLYLHLAQRLGASHLLQKPFELATLIEIVRRALAEKASRA